MDNFRILLLSVLVLFSAAVLHAEDYGDYFDEEYSDDGYYEDEYIEEGDVEEGENSIRVNIENAIDILERNQGITLVPEQFIYPFAAEHQPMLASNLVSSVQKQEGGFRNTKIVDNSKKEQQKLKAKTRIPGKIIALGDTSSATPAPSSATASSSKSPESKVSLPDFEITGKFGTATEQYIVIGNRYYTVDERLKGSRTLRRVRVVGIDEDMAYFSYMDMTFPKKIKALERIF
jgi:hypothetical protein